MIRENPRTTLHVPKNSKLYRFLENGDSSKAKWELIEDLIPDSIAVQDFADYQDFIKKVSKRHKDVDENLYVLWRLIAKRIFKISDEKGEEVFLDDSYFDLLKKM